MPTDLKGWHPGEIAIQRMLGFEDAVRTGWQLNENSMREQHRLFHTSNLPFIPVTILDDLGRPWASILTGPDGEIGFVQSPDNHTLTIETRLWEGEPLQQVFAAWFAQRAQGRARDRFLTAGLGIEFHTRRRNKFAGWIADVYAIENLDYKLTLNVNQALGNCPKYINGRLLIPYPTAQPEMIYSVWNMSSETPLPSDIVEFITNADTVFIGSVFKAKRANESRFPSHAGMNARGGLPGFVRVRPSNGRTIVLPDYSGNRFLSSLGNIHYSGVVALTIVSFTTGDILYITGRAQVLIGPAAFDVMPRQGTITVIEPTGYRFVRNALPVRQAPGTTVDRSPYSPPIKYLSEEPEGISTTSSTAVASLSSATQFADDIMTFYFKVEYRSSTELTIKPGQAIALDFMDWMGAPDYQHMAADAPGSLNDDRIRTWTVSSAHQNKVVTGFKLTMREKKGGAVTTALFDAVRKQSSIQNRITDIDLQSLEIKTPVIGVTGDFDLLGVELNMLWVAGGIGITPFMSMLEALSDRGPKATGEISLALATREPVIFLRLIESVLPEVLPNLQVRLDIFTNEAAPQVGLLGERRGVKISIHKGRIQRSYWQTVAHVQMVYICGPGEFGDTVEDELRRVGIANENILREGFF